MKNLLFVLLLIPLLVGCTKQPENSDVKFSTGCCEKYMNKVCIEGVRYYYDGNMLAPALQEEFGNVVPVKCDGSEKK